MNKESSSLSYVRAGFWTCLRRNNILVSLISRTAARKRRTVALPGHNKRIDQRCQTGYLGLPDMQASRLLGIRVPALPCRCIQSSFAERQACQSTALAAQTGRQRQRSSCRTAASAVEVETPQQALPNGGLHAPDTNGHTLDPSLDVDSVLAQELSENGKPCRHG